MIDASVRSRCGAVVGCVVTAGLVWMGGCSSPLAERPFEEWAGDRAWASGSSGSGGGAAVDADGERRGESLPEEPGVEDYVVAAVRGNPRVLAARRNVQRVEARVGQVTALEDPMLSVTPVGEMAETAAGRVGWMAGVSQRLPLPAKLDARGEIARQEVLMARAELEETILEVRSQTLRAYGSFYAADGAMWATRQSRGLLEQLREAAVAGYRAGTAGQGDVLRAGLELAAVDRELNTLAAERAAAEAMLNRLMGGAVDRPLPDPVAVRVEAMEGTLDGLLAEAGERNPGLAGLRERVTQDRQRMRLARLSRWPDLTVGVNYAAVDEDGLAVMANGDDQWSLTLGINLPIWGGKYDAAEREAYRGMQGSIAELRAAGDEVAFDVRDAFERVRAHHANVLLLRETVIPQARQAVEAALSGYRGGGGDFTAVVETWRRLLEFEQMRYRNEAMWQGAVADLHKAVGGAVGGSPAAARLIEAIDSPKAEAEVQP